MSGFFPQTGLAPSAKPRTPRVTDRAAAYWTAAAVRGDQLIDLTGRGNHLTLGADGVAKPTLLTFTGAPYVYIPDVAGNKITRDSDSLEVSTPGVHLEGCEVLSSTQVRDAEGETWTITRTAAEYDARTAIVERTAILFGRHAGMARTEAFATSRPDLDAGTRSFTAVVLARKFGNMGYGAQFISKRINRDGTRHPTTGGYALSAGSANVEHITDEFPFQEAPYSVPDGDIGLLGIAIDRDADVFRSSVNGITGTVVALDPTRDLTGNPTFYVGRAGVASSYGTFEFYAAAVFHEALTQEELTELAAEWGVGQDF